MDGGGNGQMSGCRNASYGTDIMREINQCCVKEITNPALLSPGFLQGL